MTKFSVVAICGTCSEELEVILDLPESYSDEELRSALETVDEECEGCYEINWITSGQEPVALAP